MQTEKLIRNLILMPCPDPTGVAISCENVAGKLFFVIRPDAMNVTRLVGRAGSTILALKALVTAIAPNATLNLMDAVAHAEPCVHQETKPIDTLEAVGKALDFAVTAKTTTSGTAAVLPQTLPATLRFAIQIVFRNANRHPAGALFLQ